MVKSTETIIAQATPQGVSGLAIIRVSGPSCKLILRDLFKLEKYSARLMKLNYFYDLESNVIDRGMVAFFPSPNSFTGEDMIEIFPHGSLAIVEKILNELLKFEKTRFADPGEFFKRAILAKKLSLMDAENLNNLIHAQTEQERKLISWQSFGGLRNQLNEWKRRLIKLMALCEATIEFDTEDENILNSNLHKRILDILQLVTDTLLKSSLVRKSIGGKKIVICGPPNVGKSSIFNLLNQEDRSIVSKKTGTTRDIVSSSLIIREKKLNIYDTAGMCLSKNEIEKIGVDKAKDLINKGNNIIVVLSADVVKNEYALEMKNILKKIKRKKVVIFFNKSDLKKNARKIWINLLPDLKKYPYLTTSCVQRKSNRSMYVQVAKFLYQTILEKQKEEFETGVFIEKRHFEHLKKMKKHLVLASRKDVGIEITAEELRLSLLELEKITGKIENEKKFDYIFRNFCIGK